MRYLSALTVGRKLVRTAGRGRKGGKTRCAVRQNGSMVGCVAQCTLRSKTGFRCRERECLPEERTGNEDRRVDAAWFGGKMIVPEGCTRLPLVLIFASSSPRYAPLRPLESCASSSWTHLRLQSHLCSHQCIRSIHRSTKASFHLAGSISDIAAIIASTHLFCIFATSSTPNDGLSQYA